MTASQRAKNADFQRVDTLASPWLQRIKDDLADRATRLSAQHAACMAELPAGTCERCYGTGLQNGTQPCSQCNNQFDSYAPGVPYEFHGATLANYREDAGNKTALAKAREFLTGTADLYLTGGVGSGKTRLACSIANFANSKSKHVRFVRVPQMLHALQPGRDDGEVTELERQLFTTAILVMDDIGAERDQASDYTRRTLLMIYEERGDRGLRTILTSNKTIQQLGDMQDDDRLASRIAGRADVIELTTTDQRMNKRRSGKAD